MPFFFGILCKKIENPYRTDKHRETDALQSVTFQRKSEGFTILFKEVRFFF